MKKVAIVGPRRVEVIDAPDPVAADEFVVVKVLAAPMCTEYKGFVAGNRSAFLGHEAAGEVVEVARPGRVRVGDRVVVMPQYPCGVCELCVAGDYIHCEHGVDVAARTGCIEGAATMAQYLVKQDWLLPRVPDGLCIELASLACCALGPSYGAFEAMGLGANDTVLIAGAGPVGLGAVVNALYRGARVLVAESKPERVDRARVLGAEAVVNPADPGAVAQIRELTRGLGVDAAIDCAGCVAAERLCIDAARRKGRVAFVGECGDELPIRVSPDLIRKGLTLYGSWHYNLRYAAQILRLIQRSPVVGQLISHTFPMSMAQQAFEVSAMNVSAKILLKPWE
jgi:threonine dehydrogenase-like Zn-dependent dehydrogenase